jgi:putative transposase
MCRVLELSRSGYYAWRSRRPSARSEEDQRLREQIRGVHRASRARYGSPRVHAELRVQGIRCARKRVARLMRAEGLKARSWRRARTRALGLSSSTAAQNQLQRRFAVEQVPGLDRVWVSDLTFVPTQEGWLYLAVVLDLASRRVIGWAMQRSPEAALAERALTMAVLARRPPAGVLHHSDQGVQYRAQSYQALLAEAALVPSMSRRGNCWDNAVAESFFATLEKELLQHEVFRTHREARAALFEFIEIWYNRQRRHSTLGYCTPAEFEERLALEAGAT